MNKSRWFFNVFWSAFIILSFSISANDALETETETETEIKTKANMLEKAYKLDAVMGSGVCPEELKKARRMTRKDFGCDRVRIEHGYPSTQAAQCKSRKDLANRIVYEYNLFIEDCKDNKPE